MKKKTPFLLWFLLALALIGLIGLIVTPCITKSFDAITGSFLALFIISLVALIFVFAVTKEISPASEEGVVDEKASTAICPSCGHENQADAPYCTHCGFPLK